MTLRTVRRKGSLATRARNCFKRASPVFDWLSWIAIALTVILAIAHINA